MKSSLLFLTVAAALPFVARAADSDRAPEHVAPPPAADADSAKETATIKFSDPSKPGTLRVTVSNGDIHVHGADTTAISVDTDVKPENAPPRPDGLRVLTTSSTYALTEKNNVVTLVYGAGFGGQGNGNFEVTVPRNTNVVVANSLGGDIEVGDVTGDIEIKTLNGEVKLDNVVGGTLVETMNGEVAINLSRLADAKPVSVSSMNGEVRLNLPADTKASVRLRTHNGSILTDFDEKQLVTKTATLGPGGRYRNHAEAQAIRTALRDAVRAGMDAARDATEAAAEALREASKQDREHSHEDDNDESETSSAPVPPVPPVPALPPMTGGKIVTGTLNGGGTEIRITTMNGDVVLRKSQPAKS